MYGTPVEDKYRYFGELHYSVLTSSHSSHHTSELLHHLPADEVSNTYWATASISSSSRTFPQAGMAPLPLVTCGREQKASVSKLHSLAQHLFLVAMRAVSSLLVFTSTGS